MCRRDIDGVCFRVVTHGESQIADGAAEICLHENIFTLQVAVRNSGLSGALLALFALRLAVFDVSTDDVHVKMRQASGDCQRHQNHRSRVDRVSCEEVEERTVLVVIGHQPQLSPRAVVLVVGSDEAENVVVTKHRRLVNFGFACPRTFFATRKDFHGNAFTSPATAPNLTEAAVANDFLQLNLPCD